VVAAASNWFQIVGFVDSGKKIDISRHISQKFQFFQAILKKFDFSRQFSKEFRFFQAISHKIFHFSRQISENSRFFQPI